jgi:beta-N-acetylhexosaminidase
VTRHARAFIEAHHEQDVLCAVKHFPGHGSATGDTHEGWVDVSDTWSWDELLPFTHTVDTANAIMTAHVFNANLDPEHPATLSRATIGGLIRGKLAYDGVVISDDMQMGAITNRYGYKEAVQRAIEAGVDILAFANNSVYETDIVARVIAHIKHLVKNGLIEKDWIDRSYRHIQRLKETL